MSYYTHAAEVFAHDTVKHVFFEEKSDIWVRLVQYTSGGIGLQVCPLKQIINGGPVWTSYTDSAPANRLMAFFFNTVGVDGVRRLQEQEGRIVELEVALKSTQTENRSLENQLQAAQTQLDALQTDLARMNRRNGALPLSTDHPYR